jgi:pimeloyl-ACP methyl ester carboxylesterase
MDPGLLRFAESQMNTAEKRKKVYFSWVVLRHLEFNMRKLAALLNENNIHTILIAGQFDKVIRVENLSRLSKHLNDQKTLVIESGHNNLLSNPGLIESMKNLT